MKWLFLIARKWPQWFIASAIIATSGAVFSVWWVFRTPEARRPEIGPASVRGQQGVTAEAPSFELADVVLAGNTLINFRTGEVLFKHWLEGAGDNLVPIIGIQETDKLVIAAKRGAIVAFGFDGKPKPPITVEGKPVGAAAISPSMNELLFVQNGDLWRGKLDWRNSIVQSPQRVTDSGVFRDDSFSQEWFWTGEDLYLSVLGQPHLVTLLDGKMAPNQPPIGALVRGASANRKLGVLTLGAGQFGVVEFESTELKRFPTLGNLKQVRWLSPTRVAVLGAYRKLSVYDHAVGDVVGNFELKSQIKAISSSSPSARYLLLETGIGGQILDLDTGVFTPVTHPMTDGAWISGDTLLCSNALTDSAIRGIWVYRMDGLKERIANQPFDSAAMIAGSRPALEVNGGVVFVSEGDLWFYQNTMKTLRRVTRGEKLVPNLKALEER